MKNNDTENWNDMLVVIGRIEGQLKMLCTLSERVNRLEQWQSWLKGAWAALGAACIYLLRHTRTVGLVLVASLALSITLYATNAAASKDRNFNCSWRRNPLCYSQIYLS